MPDPSISDGNETRTNTGTFPRVSETENVAREGIVFIGDPHVAAFPPGHRIDDYADTVIEKLSFCLEAACERNCLPVILGDLFHVPRNNPNHLMADLMELFRKAKPWVLVGNHDKHEARLTRDVSLYLLHAAGAIRLIDQPGPVASLKIRNSKVLIGASPDWTPIPREVDRGDHDYVIWLSHHDLVLPGYESGRFRLKELPGVDLVVNGHIHTPKPPQRCGCTTWFNPGNIARIARSRYTKALRPAIHIWRPGETPGTPTDIPGVMEPLEVPHRPFEEVFPPLSEEQEAAGVEMDESRFIRGIENLSIKRTTEGVGLKAFLESNLDRDDPLDRVIWELYEEVMSDGKE